jgi:lipoprotein-anchoring transpeptidase ErfK/SrfK
VLGTFKLGGGGSYFWSDKTGGAKYYRIITGPYYFHSIPTTRANGPYSASMGAELGHRASHGCVRLAVPDAIWLYRHMPKGVRVIVR